MEESSPFRFPTVPVRDTCTNHEGEQTSRLRFRAYIWSSNKILRAERARARRWRPQVAQHTF
eukprot:scaffold265219_cov40-Attheya_sp.AAC.1